MIKEISIKWHIDDVKEVRSDLTDEQCSEVLQALKKNHDANEGINWLTIEYTADILFPLEEEN